MTSSNSHGIEPTPQGLRRFIEAVAITIWAAIFDKATLQFFPAQSHLLFPLFFFWLFVFSQTFARLQGYRWDENLALGKIVGIVGLVTASGLFFLSSRFPERGNAELKEILIRFETVAKQENEIQDRLKGSVSGDEILANLELGKKIYETFSNDLKSISITTPEIQTFRDEFAESYHLQAKLTADLMAAIRIQDQEKMNRISMDAQKRGEINRGFGRKLNELKRKYP